MLALLVEGLLELLAPPTCAACQAPLPAARDGFCAACAPLLEVLSAPPCRAASGAGDRDVDACAFGGPLRDALHRFKYEGASELAPALAALLLPAAARLLGRVDCVVPVPLHPRRLRARGYNQAALLAGPVARALSVRLAPGLLARVRDAPAQVGRARAARQAQLSGAFVARRGVRGRACLVVDDVRTTGATLAEARRALSAAGAVRVDTLALACALGEETGPLAG